VDPAQRRLLGLLALTILFEGYGRALPTVTLPYIGDDLGVTAPHLSFALALVATGSLGILVLGPAADRLGRRRLLLASVLLYSVLGAASASAAALPALVVWQAGARMFQEGALAGATVIATEEMPAHRRGEAQGLLGGANALGAGLVAFLLGGIEYIPGGWRGLAVVCLTPLAALPFLRRTLPESQRWILQSAQPVRFRLTGYGGRAAAVLTVSFLAMSYDVAGFSFTAYVPRVSYGWSPGAVSAMIIVAGGLGMPGWWLGGRLADRSGRRITMVLFLAGLTAAQLAFFLGGEKALWPAFAAMVFCQAGKTATLRAWATELFPTSVRGTTAAWLAASATLGGMAGLGAAGTLAPVLGGIGNALALIALAGIAAATVAWLYLPETRGLELEAIAPELPT
jgi:MFS family permease